MTFAILSSYLLKWHMEFVMKKTHENIFSLGVMKHMVRNDKILQFKRVCDNTSLLSWENCQLVIDEPVEFDKSPVEV
jgi:hypothetical protein